MSHDNATIIYTLTDEPPLLATTSLLPLTPRLHRMRPSATFNAALRAARDS